MKELPIHLYFVRLSCWTTWLLFSAAILLFSLFVAPGSSWAEGVSYSDPIGPIELRSQYALNAVRLTGSPFSPAVLNPSESRVALGIGWTSTFARRDPYTVDEERVEARLRYDLGIQSGIEFGVELPTVWRGGGALDSFIDGWHDFFSLPEGGRNSAERDAFFVQGITDDSSPFALEEEGLALGNIILLGKYQLLDGDGKSTQLAIRPSISLPTASSGYGHSGVDLGLELAASKRLGESVLYLGGGLFSHGDRSIRGLRYKPYHGELFAGLEYSITESLVALLALGWSSELVSNVRDHPHHSSYLDLGLGYRISYGSALKLGVRENPSAARGTPDVTLFFDLSQRFG